MKQPHPRPPILRMILFLSAGLMAISSSAILIRWAQQPGFEIPSLTIAFWRVSFSLLLLLPLWMRSTRWRLICALSPRQRWQLIGAGFFMGVHFWSWITSLEHTSVAASVLLVTTNPVWIGLIAPWLLGERLTWRGWLGISIAMAATGGIALLSTTPGSTPNSAPLLGNFLALIGALCASGYLMMGRIVRPHLDLWTYASVTLFGAWIVIGLATLFQAPRLIALPMLAWPLLLSMALLPQMIGHNSLSWSLRYLRADTVAVLILFEPVGSSLLAWLFLHELPHISVIIAGPLLLFGIAIVIRETTKLPP